VTKLARRTFGISLTLTLLAGCAAQGLHRDGLAAIDRGDYEKGVDELHQAVVREPRNVSYRLDFEERRESAVQTLIADADAARRAGAFDVAGGTYLRVLNLDPANDRARHGLAGIEGDKRHAANVELARKDLERKDYDAADQKLRGILNEDPGYGPAQELTADVNAARGSVTVAPRLQTRDNRKVTLQLRDAPTKMVFEVLQRETGINFVLDKDVKSDGKTSIFVQDVPVDQAIDLVLEQNQLARQILAANMVLIYPNTAAKQKDYEQQIVRTFYLTNAAPKDAESMLKTVLSAKTLYIDERANVIVMRDTPDAIRMAEKLMDSLDVAEPEVMLEVEVLEISRSRIQDLGIQYPSTATFTPESVAAAASGAATTGGLLLSDLSHQSSKTIGVSNLSLTVNALKQAGRVNTLASPRIRARNKEKAKILIGQREPVITNSVTPTAAGTPVVTGSVQYLDVGLTLEVQPTVYRDSDVAIKVNLEVSNILKQVQTTSGTIAYEIGTRNANTLLRLKDGETQILAGLIQDTDTRTANSIPLIGEIPILSHLFGTNHSDREKDEIVLSITPRIIRMQSRPAPEATEFWYGNESRTHIGPYTSDFGSGGRAAQPGVPAQSGPPAVPEVYPLPPGGPQPVNPSLPAGAVSAPLNEPIQTATPSTRSTPLPSPTYTTPAAVEQGLPISAPPAPIAAAESAGPEARIAETPGQAAENAGHTAESTARTGAVDSGSHSALSVAGPTDAKVGQEFDVQVQLSTQEPLTHLRAQLRFDASALQLLSASVGSAVPASAGAPTVSTRGAGAQLEFTASSDDPVQGTGTLMTTRFKALAPRPSTSIAAMLNVLGGRGAAVGSSSAQPLQIAIEPP
jgi:general secretion pathway protein D